LAEQVKYLGFILLREGILPDLDKVAVIQYLAIPKTRGQLHSFFGICSFIRETINRYSDLMAPLTNLLLTKKVFKWTDAHTKVFKAVQAAVMQATMLLFPDYSCPFKILSDALNYEVGAIIAQKVSDGEPGEPDVIKHIAFFAQK
jgi:RNase H-like domain found in reverse transcriptase